MGQVSSFGPNMQRLCMLGNLICFCPDPWIPKVQKSKESKLLCSREHDLIEPTVSCSFGHSSKVLKLLPFRFYVQSPH